MQCGSKICQNICMQIPLHIFNLMDGINFTWADTESVIPCLHLDNGQHGFAHSKIGKILEQKIQVKCREKVILCYLEK